MSETVIKRVNRTVGTTEISRRPVTPIHHGEMLRYMQITPAEIEAIKQLDPVLSPRLSEIIDQFYEYLLPFPATHSHFVQPGLVERLKQAQYDYFKTLLKAEFDDDYIASRKMIGNTHERIGLEPRWYIGGYALFSQLIFPIIRESFRDPHKIEVIQMALLKAFFLDMQIAMETYIERYAGELVEARDALEQKLWMEDRLLSFILTEASDAIVGLDDEDRISTWSPGAQRMFGYRTSDILDKSLEDLLENPEILNHIRSSLNEKGSAVFYGSDWKTKTGSIITADASLTKLLDDKGIHIGSTLILRDTTEIKRLAAKVKSMEQLQAMTKVTASVAHEIRTPLGVMALTGDILSDRLDEVCDKLDESNREEIRTELQELVGDMQREVDRLNEIVDHYLVLSRIRRPNMSRMNLKAYLLDVVEEISKRCGDKQIEIRLDSEQDELNVNIDPDHIRRVLLNLFENARYAIKDTGQIRIHTLQEDGVVRIDFQDSGMGIPQEMQEKLFAAFVTNKQGGTGLGLYLVREIIDAHGGSVSIQSEVGKGTTISIVLPSLSDEDEANGSTV